MNQAAGPTLSAAYEELASVSRAADEALAEALRLAASGAAAMERAELDADEQGVVPPPAGSIRVSEVVGRLLNIFRGRPDPSP